MFLTLHYENESEKDIENILESPVPMYCSCTLECTENNG